MKTMEELREVKNQYQKDPVSYASGRLSHAVRRNLPQEVIDQRRRELAGAQIEKYLARMLEGVPPTKAHAKLLCKMLADAAAA